ncbi:UNKNOWN [Stylonychia lemnae]|uniref:Uncharacterized protein n=1 Tax=Stylonychia lemnae TaxID=5949 RepID=A0A078A299_STYLE|nr:UNKNOWN [Stylonychia lemnae]|eukprot:CDW76265.1 UNKNOWN [Stylonychia lemnae]
MILLLKPGIGLMQLKLPIILKCSKHGQGTQNINNCYLENNLFHNLHIKYPYIQLSNRPSDYFLEPPYQGMQVDKDIFQIFMKCCFLSNNLAMVRYQHLRYKPLFQLGKFHNFQALSC